MSTAKLVRSLIRQNGRACHWCGRETEAIIWDTPALGPPPDYMATREHLIPRAFGGPTSRWSLVIACHKCNAKRGHKVRPLPAGFVETIPSALMTEAMQAYIDQALALTATIRKAAE